MVLIYMLSLNTISSREFIDLGEFQKLIRINAVRCGSFLV